MSLHSLLSTRLMRAMSVSDTAFDGVILVMSCAKNVGETSAIQALASSVRDYTEIHIGALGTTSLLPVDKNIIPSGRLILAGTGPVTRDYDDVRRFQTAAKNGAKLCELLKICALFMKIQTNLIL
uniref:DJ-1_PfpI domain-containing protein n=1 Tax=Heterorhabditis bacteriophora TaxID=37862 RepID=A0A1I7XV76_HETBA